MGWFESTPVWTYSIRMWTVTLGITPIAGGANSVSVLWRPLHHRPELPNFYDDSLHFVLILVALMVVIVVFVPWVAPLMAMGTLAYLLQVCTCC